MEDVELITIVGPVEKIFTVFADLSHRAGWITGVTEIQILEGPLQLQQGSRWRETRVVDNQPVVHDWRVTSFSPNASYIVEGSDPNNQYRLEYTFVQVKGETTVQLAYESKPNNFTANLNDVLEFFTNHTKKGLVKELEELKAVCERDITTTSIDPLQNSPTPKA